MKKHAIALLLALLLTSLTAVAARAEEAVDLSPDCALTASGSARGLKYLTGEGQRGDHWPCAPGDTLTVETPNSVPAQGIMVSFLSDAPQLTVTANDRVIAEYAEPFQTCYIPFTEPAPVFTITVGEGVDKVRFKRLQVLSEGALPAWVQRWERLEAPADVMLVATHPDDEILWFGGLLPTYAGELGKKVVVVNTVGSSDYRHLELLAAVWACGVRYYPEIGPFRDVKAKSVLEQYKLWGGREALLRYITERIRKYRPSVLVTQDISGEFGHLHHSLTVQSTIDAVTTLAADPAFDEPTATLYGPWQPLKLYVHLWPEGEIIFDWHRPLAAFNGQTGLEVARAAFEHHVSQQNRGYSVEESGRGDCRRLGLYWSLVGPDEALDDLLEHVE